MMCSSRKQWCCYGLLDGDGVEERQLIVEETLEAGSSVARVALKHGVNANQVFKWRRAFERGELIETCSAWLPVTVSSPAEFEDEVAEQATPIQAASSGAIHIELPGPTLISVESGADHILIRAILESLQK
jgi:transposase